MHHFLTEGAELWSAGDLARVLEYSIFRNFLPVIEKAKGACAKSGFPVADHFAKMRNMVEIGSGAQPEIEDWALCRYACYLVIQNADPAVVHGPLRFCLDGVLLDCGLLHGSFRLPQGDI